MCNVLADTDRARKHGMEEYISADPVKFEHSLLFKLVQTLTLDFRLNDPYASLVRKPRVLFFHLSNDCLLSFINMDRLSLACRSIGRFLIRWFFYCVCVCRAGSHPDRSLFLMNTALGTEFVAATATCIIYRIFSTELNAE